ncbi:uncharacterized protein [Physcomitrium patens]|uniref:uncharacterized protein isoform X5 n=1 Tax=Physcomitrium patens TaxID=3218 RepID=UPI000D165CCA|nr:intraflagellar transport protein 140 homolog isoform X5 [Physcomitrium patens]|eukprot:XP_024391640.1 intraflagellar transport protein 140 homolog isoform X5 [Physcomitrella patens]
MGEADELKGAVNEGWNFAWRCRGRFAIVQIASNQAAILQLDAPDSTKVLTVVSAINGVNMWKQNYLIWKLHDAEIFELNSHGLKHVAKIGIAEGAFLAIHNCFVFMTTQDGVEVLSLQGEHKQLLVVDHFQGKSLQLEVCEEVLVAVTSENRIRSWKIERNEVKLSGLPSGRKVDQVEKIQSLRCNCDGTKISFFAESPKGDGTESKLFVYDEYLDKFLCYDFGDRRPVSHYWDDEDCKLLACHIICSEEENSNELGEKETAASFIFTFFVTSDYPQGIFEYEKIVLLDDQRLLVGVSIPYLMFYTGASRPSSDELAAPGSFEMKVFRDYVGLEGADQKTKKGLSYFNYNLVLGPVMLVAAYQSIAWIQDHAFWKALAAICVQTKRTDIAAYCFGRMQDAYGAELIEEAEKEPEEDARVAMVALQLGQIDDAKQLYANCKRYDLVNRLHQLCCEWEKALEVATKNDRIHLKNTHHSYAKYLEARGNYKDAIHHFELSGSHRYEVPRMLYAAQQVEELQDYIDNSSDPALQRWWAHFCEANDLLSEAIEYYIAARDTCSLVRVYCYQKDFEAASEVVTSSGDFAGAFQLAREYEKIGDILQAIQFFKMAGKSSYAAQLAMKTGMDSELLPLSLQGGDLGTAIDICFRSQLFDALRSIAEGLDESADPSLLTNCGDYLLQHKQFDKAVKLFIAAKLYHKALDVCTKEGITITGAMAEVICPKGDHRKDEEYSKLLMRLAASCLAQGSYHLACKKYTQAGDRVMATKALLKSGDTERIIFFAHVSRQKEIFVLAANYLQTLDWHGDANLMRIIVQMYTKAGDTTSLASFYEACAQIEIDEFRDYEKALGAMSEALKYLEKTNNSDKDDQVKSLQTRISEMEHFGQIRKMAKTDPAGMVRACRELLVQVSRNKGSPQAALRVGDLYALLIEFYFRQRNMEQAYELIEEMQCQKIPLSQYIDQSTVESIYKALGIEAAEDSLSEGISEEIASLDRT